MRINDENILRELRKNTEKHKRVNSYKVKYMKFDGINEELTFNQGYDASTDVYNPFFVRVYDANGSYLMSGSGSTVESSYNSLITGLILYMNKARNDCNESAKKLAQIGGILNIEDEHDDRLN